MDKTQIKTVYSYDANGKYISEKILDWTDRSQISGAWQIPAGCTEIAPPAAKDGYNRVFANGTWSQVAIPVEPEKPVDPKQPIEQEHQYIDPSILALAEAIAAQAEIQAAQESRLTKLEGSASK